MQEIVIRPHAIKRAQEMGVSQADIRSCVNEPEVSYPSHESYGPNNWIAQRGGIAVAYAIELGIIVVVSVLERTQDQYERAS